MSIVIRMPNRRICIFCKGADSTIVELLRLRELASENAREVERRSSGEDDAGVPSGGASVARGTEAARVHDRP